jgi:hypothetical protein
MVAVDDDNSVAAYDPTSHKLVVVEVTREAEEKTLDLSRFSVTGDTVQLVATTTSPGSDVPDWKQHVTTIKIERRGDEALVSAHLHPKSIYTFVIETVRH